MQLVKMIGILVCMRDTRQHPESNKMTRLEEFEAEAGGLLHQIVSILCRPGGFWYNLIHHQLSVPSTKAFWKFDICKSRLIGPFGWYLIQASNKKPQSLGWSAIWHRRTCDIGIASPRWRGGGYVYLLSNGQRYHEYTGIPRFASW